MSLFGLGLRSTAFVGGRSAFAPTDISDLLRWYDASAITGLSDNDGVTTWEDLSASGVDLTGNGVIYKTGIVNGKPVVRFDGVDDWLSSTGDVTLSTVTTFVVMNQTNTSIQRTVIGSSATGGFEFRVHTTRALEILSQASVLIWRSGTLLTAASWGTAELSLDSGGSTAYWNGAGNTSTNTGTISAGAVRIGSRGTANWFLGDIAEVLIYSRVLDATERGQVRSYLSSKYAL